MSDVGSRVLATGRPRIRAGRPTPWAGFVVVIVIGPFLSCCVARGKFVPQEMSRQAPVHLPPGLDGDNQNDDFTVIELQENAQAANPGRPHV